MREVVIMVAPNGARKTRSDHSSLPVSIEDTVSEAALCRAVGASALHAHVRGANDEHVLDAGLYRELIAAMAQRVPGMLVQITSEAVGIYSPQQQESVPDSSNPTSRANSSNGATITGYTSSTSFFRPKSSGIFSSTATAA
jgi:uncharacterized protein (DUF849 family)